MTIYKGIAQPNQQQNDRYIHRFIDIVSCQREILRLQDVFYESSSHSKTLIQRGRSNGKVIKEKWEVIKILV